MQANASTIATENTSRSQCKTSVHEESTRIKNLIPNSPEKIKCLAPWVGHVCKAGSHITRRTHITRGIQCMYIQHVARLILSSLCYYLLLIIIIALAALKSSRNCDTKSGQHF
jgi:hypothetical protein